MLEIIKMFAQMGTGKYGGKYIDAGGTATGNVFAIQSVGTTAELGVILGNIEALSGKTIEAGDTVFGEFSSVQAGPAATDKFICYYRK
jgi:hypothetical protein